MRVGGQMTVLALAGQAHQSATDTGVSIGYAIGIGIILLLLSRSGKKKK
jgi:hypothetical protein